MLDLFHPPFRISFNSGNVAVRFVLPLIACLFLATAQTCAAKSGTRNIVVGHVRVQLLSDSLVRLELRGAEGFEDRASFHVINRNWPGTAYLTNSDSGDVVIRTAHYTVRVPQNAQSLDGVQVQSSNGQLLYAFDGKLENNHWLPGPADKPEVWSFADTPRIIPPSWGLTPPPANSRLPNCGWDLNNDAPDVYVFVPGGNYFTLREDFLKLTGPTEMPPLFALGAFDSRWYDYTEATALQQIDDYRAHQIPLDVLVVDTGWRQNASTGYQPNTNLFPNMERFFQEAHAKHVRIMFNDHPEPVSKIALDPKELEYRYDNLAKLLNEGLDFWWYDRNWMVHLVTPAPNLNKEVWGMQLYHDTTVRVRPESRPLIMANVDGIDNGMRRRPMDAASHRFPIQWTGDIGPDWTFLRRAVENAVFSGAQSLFPYESDDLGGHTSNPTPEQYIRWIEYGALSPVYRPHCTHNLKRMPWTFGPEAGNVAKRFVDLRYRLLPVFYAAAHENYETGEPLLRRLDLDYPQYPEARGNDEYLLGKDILVAPVLEGTARIVPADWLKAPDGQPGLKAEFFENVDLSGTPALTRTDAGVDFDWGMNSPAPNLPGQNYSVRWTGTIEVPAATGDVVLSSLADDGARVWVDGEEVINAWGPHALTATEASAALTAGRPHRLRIEYLQLGFDAAMKLQWHSVKARAATRVAWIPPGNWINAWTGETISGPTTVTNTVPLDQIPLYIKSGAVLPLAPEMQYTGDPAMRDWDPILLDCYPAVGGTNSTTLYEDDTLTTAYQHGKFRKTDIRLTGDKTPKAFGAVVRVEIYAAKGTFPGALNKRAWTLRIHPPANWPKDWLPKEVKINGKASPLPVHRLVRAENTMPLGDPTGAPDEDVFEINLPATRVSHSQSIYIAFAP
jgi:alpha-glucosidase (family GH31 glycosyl hydrolase)